LSISIILHFSFGSLLMIAAIKQPYRFISSDPARHYFVF
jgi:hypothetical protein